VPLEGLHKLKTFGHLIESSTRDFLACCIVPLNNYYKSSTYIEALLDMFPLLARWIEFVGTPTEPKFYRCIMNAAYKGIHTKHSNHGECI
jgi:hypothetical protein